MFFLLLPLAVAVGALFVLTEPKWVTFYKGGVPSTGLVMSIGNGACLETKAATAFIAMRGLCLAQTGLSLEPSGPRSGYRTSTEQAAIRDELGAYGAGGLAAAVNMSPHQSGIACDFSGLDPAKENFNPPLRDWLLAHCHTFGWTNTGDTYRTVKEPWHYEWHPEVFT